MRSWSFAILLVAASGGKIVTSTSPTNVLTSLSVKSATIAETTLTPIAAVSPPAEIPIDTTSDPSDESSPPRTSQKASSVSTAVSSDKSKYTFADADDFGYITVIVSFTHPGGNFDDWIGIYPANAENVTAGTIPHPSVDWIFVCGSQSLIDCDEDEVVDESGSVDFLDLPPGTYRAFVALNQDAPYPVIAASDPFEVEGVIFPSGDAPLGGELNWTDDWTDDLTGDWDFSENNTLGSMFGSISTNKDAYNADESEIIVTFDNPEPRADDWVGIYPLGSAFEALEGEEEFLFLPGGSADWMYACGTQQCSGAVTSGTVTFTGGLYPGMFQAFLAPNMTAPYPAIAASEPFEITPGASSSNEDYSAGSSSPESQMPTTGDPEQEETDENTTYWTPTPDRHIVLAFAVIILASVSIYFCCKFGSSGATDSGAQYGQVELGTLT